MDRNKKGWPWPGTWKVVCDVCQMQYPSNKVKQRWDGLLVCEHDWETRHPQDLYRYKAHTSVPDFVRAEPDEDTYIFLCSLEGQSAYAGLAVAGCAQAGNTTFTYDFLLGLSRNGHE